MATPTKTYSVQPRFRRGGVLQPTGWAWIDLLFRTYSRTIMPPYGTPQRDVVLAESWKYEPILAGAINAFMERVATRPWKVAGGRINAARAVRMLNACEGGWGLSYLLGMGAGDFTYTDKGTMIEKGRSRKGSTRGPVLGLTHIDSTRMVRNYDPQRPLVVPRTATWVYLPVDQNPIPIPDSNLLHIIPTPSGRDRFRGMGYCALSRIYEALQMMIGFLTYYRQRIGNLPPELIAIINGMSLEQVKAAYESYEQERKSNDATIYPGVFFLGSDDPANPVSIDTTQFTGLPASFDWNTMQEWWVKTIALNIGEAAGEYWLLQNMGLGQQGYAVQAVMARGRGAGRFMFEVENRFNVEIMPFGIRFSFDAVDDEQDEQVAEVFGSNVDAIARMASAGTDRGEAGEFVFTIDEIRDTAIDKGVLDPEIAGEEVPFVLGSMLKMLGATDEPIVYVTQDYQIIEVKPKLTGTTADSARQLYDLLEGYYAPKAAALTQGPHPFTTRAIGFWRDFSEKYPSDDVAAHVQALEAGTAPWYSNWRLAEEAVTQASRIGKIGLNRDAKGEGLQWARGLLQQHGIHPDSMRVKAEGANGGNPGVESASDHGSTPPTIPSETGS